MSAHVLGQALVAGGYDDGLQLGAPVGVWEQPGQGIRADVDGRSVAVGSRAFMRAAGVPAEESDSASVMTGRGSGEAHVLVAVDGHMAGVIVMADELRPDAGDIVQRLRAEGVGHTSRWCPATAARWLSASGEPSASTAYTPTVFGAASPVSSSASAAIRHCAR